MSKRLLILMCSIFLVVPLLFMGCGGNDGSTGATGATGPAGPPGPPGGSATDTDVTLQDLAALGIVFSDDIEAMNPVLDLSKTVSYDNGALTIHFFLKDEAGKGIDITTNPYELRVLASELLPASASPTDNNPGIAWTQRISESGTPAISIGSLGTLTLVNAATGEYNYRCKTALPATGNVVRVTLRTRFRFRDNNNAYITVANVVNASYDFLQSAPGTALQSSGADMVTTGACESCHGARIGDVGHGGGYTQYETCTHCHNANYMATRDPEFDLAFMIHRIHNAGTFTGGADFSEVQYPQSIQNCAKCHNGPQASLAFTNPTGRNCGSCHATVYPTISSSHGGGPGFVDSECTLCHQEGRIGKGPIEAHNPPPPIANTPEFNVTLTLTPPSGGASFYGPGDNILVTVTLTKAADNSAVNPLFYTTPAGATAVTTDNALKVASLYVYGPRDEAIPVLAADTINDPLYVAPPTQAHSMFVGGTDNLVRSDATGFKYQLLTIPAGMAPGTYMIRVRVADYSRVSDTNFRIESIAFRTIQIGTATEEPRLSGDACVECHGTGTAPFHDARHVVLWKPDECLACHDKSGNHADYLGNRTHAVHRATITGDLLGVDWSEVTYPRPANNCLTCHTTTLNTPVWRQPEMLACGGCHGAVPTADPATYPAAKQDQVTREVAAAQHMAAMGGNTDPTTPQTLQCLVCHGEGRTYDLTLTHQLNRFRPLPVDPND